MLSKVIGYLKMNTSRQIHAFAPDLVVWKRSFYDHVIRNEKDHEEIWAYIDGNTAGGRRMSCSSNESFQHFPAYRRQIGPHYPCRP